MRKGEIACHKQFLLFSQRFLPYMAIIFHFKCTLKCRLQFVSIYFNLAQSKILSSGNGLSALDWRVLYMLTWQSEMLAILSEKVA